MASVGVNDQQKEALQHIFAWLANPESQSFNLAGYAGTGKSTLIAILRLIIKKKRPKWKVAFTSFTGKATRVLASKLKNQEASFKADKVSTLHSFLYAPVINNGQITSWIRKDKFDFNLLIIDEASMVTKEIWADVKKTGLPVLAVGDHGQLPPVNSNFSLMEKPDFVLKKIHRQAAESKIHEVAWLARSQGEIPVKRFSNQVVKYPAQSSETQVLLQDMFAMYQPDTLFLTGFNKSRVAINNSIRSAQWRNSEQPENGDLVVCLKNDWEVGIYNGMTGKIQSITTAASDEQGLPLSYDVEIVDEQEHLIYQGLIAAQQFGKETAMKFTRQEQREIGQLFDYGYALTVHKAQGSQARKAVVIEERSQHMDDEDWRRWLYTAVTRAEEELIIFGPDPEAKYHNF